MQFKNALLRFVKRLWHFLPPPVTVGLCLRWWPVSVTLPVAIFAK